MTKACQRWASVKEGPNPPGWVYRVGLNWSRSRWRKLRRERPLDHRAEESTVELDPTVALLQEAVARLEISQRSVVVLRYYLDWTPTEIAASLDLPVGTVKSRLHRALKILKIDLENPAPNQPGHRGTQGIDLRPAPTEPDRRDDVVDLTDQPDQPTPPRPGRRRARKGQQR